MGCFCDASLAVYRRELSAGLSSMAHCRYNPSIESNQAPTQEFVVIYRALIGIYRYLADVVPIRVDWNSV
jgi:hypothetical protein